jgi:hypothetical protein
MGAAVPASTKARSTATIRCAAYAPIAAAGDQRAAEVAQVDIARRLAEAIWHMLTTTSPSLRQAPRALWPHRRPFLRCATGATFPYHLGLPRAGDRELSPMLPDIDQKADAPRSRRP